MRRNQAILDEATRSVRKTFIGSVAGTFGMFTVVGAAGAYGMPERLSAQSLSDALTSWQLRLRPMVERAAPVVERAVALAHDVTRRAPAPTPAFEDEVVRPLPPPLVAPAIAQYEAPAVVESSALAMSAPEAPATVVPEPANVAMPVAGRAGFILASLGPVPATLSSEPMQAAPPAMPPLAAVPMPPVPATPDVSGAAETATQPALPSVAKAPAPDSTSAAVSNSVAEPKPVAEPSPAVAEEIVNTVPVPKLVMVELPRAKAPLSPAQRLKLTGKDYDRAEHCLAQAVYFEARNQSERGQMAVAQVVLNRVFSPHYPNDVCGVVFQNAHRHLSCQFTFACDGQPESVSERGAWARAQRIARGTLEARIWLPEVGKATHYHAAYVRPYWVREMRVMVRYGLHTFYRPRHWGDGSNEPAWGEGAKKDRSS